MEKINSIEKYQIDPNEIEIKIAKFLSDPISGLHYIRDQVVEEHDEDLTIVALAAVTTLRDIYDLAHDDVANVQHKTMREFLTTDRDDETGKNRCIIKLLHEAGYSEAEVMTWAKITSNDLLPRERLQERALGALVREVYSAS